MRKTTFALSLFILFISVATISTFGQYIIVGTAYGKNPVKECSAFFPTAVGFEFTNTGGTKVDQPALYKEFKKAMLDKYPQTEVSVRTARESSGFAIKAQKKHGGWPCSSDVYYFGFGKTMLDAKEQAEKATSENCRNCQVLDRMQL